MTSNTTEVVSRAYAVVDTSSLSNHHSGRSHTGVGSGKGIDSGHKGTSNASTNVGAFQLAVSPPDSGPYRSTGQSAVDAECSGWLGAGGRIDIKRQIEDFNIVASLTDNTLRDYEAAPWLKDALVTADKKISSASCFSRLPGWLGSCSGPAIYGAVHFAGYEGHLTESSASSVPVVTATCALVNRRSAHIAFQTPAHSNHPCVFAL